MTHDLADWRSYVDHYAKLYKPIQFDLHRQDTALLVIDVQKKACDPSVSQGIGARLPTLYPELAERYFERLGVTLPNIVSTVDLFRSLGMRVLFFTVGPNLPSAADMPFPFRQQYSTLHSGEGAQTNVDIHSPEFELIDDLEPRPEEIVANKVTRGAFTGSRVDIILRSFGVSNVVIVGGSTHMCVESTAREASDLGFGTVLVDDACHCVFPELHGATMAAFSMGIGRVLSTAELHAEINAD